MLPCVIISFLYLFYLTYIFKVVVIYCDSSFNRKNIKGHTFDSSSEYIHILRGSQPFFSKKILNKKILKTPGNKKGNYERKHNVAQETENDHVKKERKSVQTIKGKQDGPTINEKKDEPTINEKQDVQTINEKQDSISIIYARKNNVEENSKESISRTPYDKEGVVKKNELNKEENNEKKTRSIYVDIMNNNNDKYEHTNVIINNEQQHENVIDTEKCNDYNSDNNNNNNNDNYYYDVNNNNNNSNNSNDNNMNDNYNNNMNDNYNDNNNNDNNNNNNDNNNNNNNDNKNNDNNSNNENNNNSNNNDNKNNNKNKNYNNMNDNNNNDNNNNDNNNNDNKNKNNDNKNSDNSNNDNNMSDNKNNNNNDNKNKNNDNKNSDNSNNDNNMSDNKNNNNNDNNNMSDNINSDNNMSDNVNSDNSNNDNNMSDNKNSDNSNNDNNMSDNINSDNSNNNNNMNDNNMIDNKNSDNSNNDNNTSDNKNSDNGNNDNNMSDNKNSDNSNNDNNNNNDNNMSDNKNNDNNMSDNNNNNNNNNNNSNNDGNNQEIKEEIINKNESSVLKNEEMDELNNNKNEEQNHISTESVNNIKKEDDDNNGQIDDTSSNNDNNKDTNEGKKEENDVKVEEENTEKNVINYDKEDEQKYEMTLNNLIKYHNELDDDDDEDEEEEEEIDEDEDDEMNSSFHKFDESNENEKERDSYSKRNYPNIYVKYKDDLEFYNDKLKENDLDEFYDYILGRRNLINITYKNEYALKLKYHKGYTTSLYNLYVVNDLKLSDNMYSNFTTPLEEDDNPTLQEASYYADLSKIDIDPTIFKEYFLKVNQCDGDYLPLKNTLVEKICHLSNHLRKHPYVNKIKITNQKSILYRIFLKVMKSFKNLSVQQCIRNVDESNLLDILFLFNEEIVKESKKELNLGKCINNMIARNKDWYNLINFIILSLLGCVTYYKEHYYLNKDEIDEMKSKKKITDLPIFDFFNEKVMDVFLPVDLETHINIDLVEDVTKPTERRQKIFQSWYMIFLFIHKIYLISKMWNLVKNWEAADFVPNPWYVEHIGSALIPHVMNLHKAEDDEYTFFRYIDEVQYFMSLKRSKNFPISNYDKKLYHVVEQIITFQGTSSPSMWLTNLIYELTPYPFLSKGRLHKGYLFIFEKAVKPYLDGLKKVLLNELKDKSKYTSETPYAIVFSGHSFGAAMAQISSFYFSKIMDLKNRTNLKVYAITFGLPTYHDSTFYEDFRNSGIIVNNINVNHDPVRVIMAVPGINDFVNHDEERKLMINFEVEQLKKLNYDFGKNAFNAVEFFNVKNHQRSMLYVFAKYIFNKNVFLELGELHVLQTHYYFYYIFLTLLSGWVNEADWGTYFMVPFFLFENVDFLHNQLMNKCKEFHKKYSGEMVKKLPNNENCDN
ncbi:lipase, putative [Plasmodium sp. gorilla clade G2]|uniref:lipase, putative n=1 Tax=Plasmodium sp. gorilla clade G2 TaxID=880535 RepID=UPI000D229D5D|nr:lipase, putative [Plasmodium sp. gorilla clade G2]SOV19023.1 lipase, putative [Plasmodium sp. gorilla clade G2]